jgi:hypothetical protein
MRSPAAGGLFGYAHRIYHTVRVVRTRSGFPRLSHRNSRFWKEKIPHAQVAPSPK